MAEVRLMPRLTAAAARRVIRDYRSRIPDPGSARAAGEGLAGWAAVGGRRVMPEELTALREALVAIATECGFGGSDEKGDRAGFDNRCTIWFGQSDLIPTGEGLRDDVWTWLGVCLLPDLVSWRFPGKPEERFLGGVRNVFQRHWMRAMALDQGEPVQERWALVRALTEDAMVQIMERPSLSSQPELARAIGRAWLARSALPAHRGLEEITRDAVREIRILNESRGLAALATDELDAVVGEIFESAAQRAGAQNATDAVPSEAPAKRGFLMGALLGRGRT